MLQRPLLQCVMHPLLQRVLHGAWSVTQCPGQASIIAGTRVERASGVDVRRSVRATQREQRTPRGPLACRVAPLACGGCASEGPHPLAAAGSS